MYKPNQTSFCSGLFIKQQRSGEDRAVVVKSSNMHYYAVFDGHGQTDKSSNDPHIVDYLAENLHSMIFQTITDVKNPLVVRQQLTDIFVQTDKMLYEEGKYRYGACANIVLVAGDYVYQVNLGDCKSIVFSLDESTVTITGITSDLVCSNPSEQQRIQYKNGFIYDGRLYNVLVPCRAFGDFKYKTVFDTYEFDGALSVIPEIIVTKVNPKHKQFICLCSDGLIDCYTVPELLSNVVKNLQNEFSVICQYIVEKQSKWTTDDISMILATIN
jgi:serine/threonine protein phosphatase PrpC